MQVKRYLRGDRKTMIKKFLALITAVVLSVTLAACGGSKADSPSATTETFLKAVKKQDQQTLKSVYLGDSDSIISDSDIDASNTKVPIDQNLKSLLFDFDYAIQEEKTEGDTAVVTVEITTYPLGDVFTEWFQEFIAKAFSVDMIGAKSEDLQKDAMEALQKKFKNVKKTYKSKVDIHLEKKDADWKVSDFKGNLDFLNAVTGGILDSMKKLPNKMNPHK